MSSQNQCADEATPPVQDNFELCQRFGVECRVVGDLYSIDQHGKALSEADLKKWMVTTPAHTFPASLIQSIPLAESKTQCEQLAVQYLMLRDRDAFLYRRPQPPGTTKEKSPAIPTAVYLAFIKDDKYWPCNDSLMTYATDLVIEVDGKRYEQDAIEPGTFRNTNEVIILAGEVFVEWKVLHSMREHFANWIIGHRPASGRPETA